MQWVAMWLLRNKFRASGKPASTHDCWAITLASSSIFIEQTPSFRSQWPLIYPSVMVWMRIVPINSYAWMWHVWSPVSRAVWKGLRSVGLLEQLCHWDWTLSFKSPRQASSSSSSPLSLLATCRADVSSQLLLQHHAWLHATILHAMMAMD